MSFRVTVCCVQKCGARMVIYKLIFVALIWLANVKFMHVASYSTYLNMICIFPNKEITESEL